MWRFKCGFMAITLVMLVFFGLTSAAPYVDLVPRYSRIKSSVMVRRIDTPTLANLDYAAYTANPVLADAEKPKPKNPPAPLILSAITFGGEIANPYDRLDQTPLTTAEKKRPLAWQPLVKRLWETVKESGFQTAAARINGYKWADESIYLPYQELTGVYLHDANGTVELWGRIEFKPWVTFLGAIDDEDRDGWRELYGRLTLSGVHPDSLARAIAWIKGPYTCASLTKDEAVDWITDLASYWYPTKNTDIVDMTDSPLWPDRRTEKPIRAALRGTSVREPFAVVRGKPFSPKKPVYNVYVSRFFSGNPSLPPAAVSPAAPENRETVVSLPDTGLSAQFLENRRRFEAEQKRHGGYGAWANSNRALTDSINAFLSRQPPQQMGFAGKDGWLCFRKSLEFCIGGDLTSQRGDKNPLPVLTALKEWCSSRGISLLFVPVPSKEEVYPEKLPFGVRHNDSFIVNPWQRKFLYEAQAAGIEVVDLLPLFLKAKQDDRNSDEALFQKHDTHWTNRGLQIAAGAIAARIRAYPWVSRLLPDTTAFRVRDTVFSRQGDIVERLPAAEQPNYPAATLAASRVYSADGTPYKSVSGAPLLLMGDSFTGVFESVDCKSAGIGSNLAAKTGVPVDIITSWGGGPMVYNKALRTKRNHLSSIKVIVYLMTDRDLYNYANGWEALSVP